MKEMKVKERKNNKLLVYSDSSLIKIYLDGFGVLEFLRITRLIQTHGGRVTKPSDDTLVLTRPNHPHGTEFLRFNISWLYDSIRDNRRQDIGKYLLPAATNDNQEEERPDDTHSKDADADDSEAHEEESQKDDADEVFRGFSNTNDEELAEDESPENEFISEDSTNFIDSPEQVQNVEEIQAEEEDVLMEVNSTTMNVENCNEIPEDASPARIIIFKDQASTIEIETFRESESESPIALEDSELPSRIERHGNSSNFQCTPIIVLPKLKERDSSDVTPENTREVNDNTIKLEKKVQNEGDSDTCIEEGDNLNDSDSCINGCWRFPGNGTEDQEGSSENSRDHSLNASNENISESSILPEEMKGKENELKIKTPSKRTMESPNRSRKCLKTDILPRMKYSIEEDRKIIKYLIDREAIARADGMSVWDEMVAEGILPDRSATSLKFRFATILKHKFSDYTDDPIVLEKFQQLTTDTHQSMKSTPR